MHPGAIATLVAKDFSLFFKNRFIALITFGGILFYIAGYFFLPQSVEETFELALFAPDLPAEITAEFAGDGFVLHRPPSEAALRAGVAAGDYPAAIALPEGAMSAIADGRRPVARLYFSAEFPEEYKGLYGAVVEELGFMMAGRPLNLDVYEEILGPDMAGRQIPPRDKMRPLFAIFVLMLETLGLASLISLELEGGTLSALLVTPLGVADLFAAKGIVGVTLAFAQATLVLLATGGLSERPGLMLTALFLGSLLVTGAAFLLASVARDMMSVLAWGVLVILTFALPALTLLIPGVLTFWVRIIPTFYLVDTINRVSYFGAGWLDVSANLLTLALWASALLLLGVFVLRRKVL